MTRLLFPDEGSRLGYRVSGSPLRSVANTSATIYTDDAGTVLADIREYDGTQVPGPVIAGSVIAIDQYSRLGLFWGPDLLVNQLYAVIAGGPVVPVFARLGTVAALNANTPRLTQLVSAAAPAVNTDVTDEVLITALATDVTSFTTNLTGTPAEGAHLLMKITDNGIARNLTFGAKFAPGTVPLPTTTTAGKIQHIGFIYNLATTTWLCVANGAQP